MTFVRALLLSPLLLLLVSCESNEAVPGRGPALEHAYAGPTTLNIRQELNPKTPTVATVNHGDKLDIVEYKRRFVKVRTQSGIVGWTDTRQLLLPDQMADLDRLAANAKRMPPEGVANVFEAVNMHAEPNRTSPGFELLKEGTKVEVLEHRLTPRVQPPPPRILAPVPKPRPMRRKEQAKEKGKIPVPPMPAAPLPPRDWLEMSRTVEQPADHPPQRANPVEQPKPIPLEDWYLVRTKDGKAGWVMARMVSMAIPDDVAQYAEGHRITSYFSLGKVDDDGAQKDNWLWTTIAKGSEPYEFDSFRVFVWSRRHHRYETAYVQRGVVGHYPVEVNTSGENPGFSLILEGDDGALYRKTYVFNGYRLNVVSTERYQTSNPEDVPMIAIAQNRPPVKEVSWYGRVKDRISKLFNR